MGCKMAPVRTRVSRLRRQPFGSPPQRMGPEAPVFVLASLLRSRRSIPNPRRGWQRLAPGGSPEIETCASPRSELRRNGSTLIRTRMGPGGFVLKFGRSSPRWRSPRPSSRPVTDTPTPRRLRGRAPGIASLRAPRGRGRRATVRGSIPRPVHRRRRPRRRVRRRIR